MFIDDKSKPTIFVSTVLGSITDGATAAIASAMALALT